MKRRLFALFFLLSASALCLAQVDAAKLRALASGPQISFSVSSDTGVWGAAMAEILKAEIQESPDDWLLKARRASYLSLSGDQETAEAVAETALASYIKAKVEDLQGEQLFLFATSLEIARGPEGALKFLDEVARDAASDPGYWLARAYTALNQSVRLQQGADGNLDRDETARSVRELLEERMTHIAKACELGPNEEYVMRERVKSDMVDALMGRQISPVMPKRSATTTPEYRLFDLFSYFMASVVSELVRTAGQSANPLKAMELMPADRKQAAQAAAEEIYALSDDVEPEMRSCALEYGYVASYFTGNFANAREAQETWRDEFEDSASAAIATLTLATLRDDLSEACQEATEIAGEFPSNAEIQAKAGRILERAGELPASRDCWVRAAKLSGGGDVLKGSPESRMSLAALHLKSGTEADLKDAGALLTSVGEVVEELENHLQSHYAFLSVIYLGLMGDVEEARDIAKDLIAGNPGEESYKEALKALG